MTTEEKLQWMDKARCYAKFVMEKKRERGEFTFQKDYDSAYCDYLRKIEKENHCRIIN